MVTYTEFSVLPGDSEGIRKTLDGLLNAFLKDKSKKLLNERDMKIEGYAGRELLVEDGDNFLACRTFLTRTRAYEIMLYVPRQSAFKSGRASSDRSDFTDSYELISTQFFDSFKLMNGGSATPVNESSVTTDGRTKIVSGGVINGKAISLPRPIYPSLAQSRGVHGTVSVQVTIDEEGKVIEAKALSGHPLLRDAAVKAALKARFTITRLEGLAVKVAGTINYNF
jgi:TonB family protein